MGRGHHHGHRHGHHHNHDSADLTGEALAADGAGRRALLLSLAGLGLTAALQLAVVAVSGSVALLGDGLHNAADALTAIPLLVAFTLARRPATARFTYGYGRAEDLAGIFVILAITASSLLAAYTAVDRLLHPRPVTHLAAVALAAAVGCAGNEIVARYRITVGRRIGSAALVADGLHARTDGLTSLAVLAGAGGVALGWRWADPVVGLVITVAILGVLRSAASLVAGRLLDAVDPELVAEAGRTLAHTPGIEAVDALRLRWVGHSLRAEVDVRVDPALTLVAAHELAHAAEAHLTRHLSRLAAATVHTSPAGQEARPDLT
jgi:cation diffusion facilitator family transporter